MALRLVLAALLVGALSACDSVPAESPNVEGCAPLTSDPALQAVFPSQIDGQPVTNVQSARFLETICVEGGQAGVEVVASRAPAGVELDQVFVGSAETTVDGAPLRLTAYRVPGADEAAIMQAVSGLAQAVGGDGRKFGPDNPLVQAGGKTVRTWTDAEGRTSYLYVSSDVLVVVDGVSPSQADRILASF